jgi:peptidoglycan/LPS O-acetylase OafA/YrhL
MERMQLAGWNDTMVFYVRRFFRLFPLAALTVLVAIAMQSPPMPWAKFEMPDLWSVVSNLTLTTNLTYAQPTLSPLWSLAVEAQMYVTLPMIFLIVRKRPGLALALWVASIPFAWIQPQISERLNTLAYVPCFMGGVLAYTLTGQRRVHIDSAYWLPALLVLSAIYMIVQSYLHMRFMPTGWVTCLALGAGIPLFLDSTATRLNQVAEFIARYSYGIYLFHPIALWFGCVHLDLPFWVQWTVAAVMLGTMSAAGYHWIEKPAIEYGLGVSSRMAPRMPVAVPRTGLSNE